MHPRMPNSSAGSQLMGFLCHFSPRSQLDKLKPKLSYEKLLNNHLNWGENSNIYFCQQKKKNHAASWFSNQLALELRISQEKNAGQWIGNKMNGGTWFVKIPNEKLSYLYIDRQLRSAKIVYIPASSCKNLLTQDNLRQQIENRSSELNDICRRPNRINH